ncbi:MAG: SigE family RNA polymerase sigma factor [Acidimicrobiia bacterium]
MQHVQMVGSGDDIDDGRDHSTDAFDSFYANEHRAVLRLATALVDDPSRAEELVQDCFERAYLRWSHLDNPNGFLRHAVVNACRSELRRRRVARLWTAPRIRDDEMPEPQLELLAALRDLAPRKRLVLVLRFYADLTEPAIAEILNCPVGTVKSLVSRGLDDLRKVVEP